MIIKTSAVVLREIKYRDQSKICLLFTREFGKISVMIKAGRNPGNKLNALVCTGNLVDTIIYKKNNRDIQLVSDANLLFSPMTLSPDLERYGVLYTILDLVRHSTASEEKNVPLFILTAKALELLCNSTDGFQLILAWFLFKLVSILGFEPSVERCVFSRQVLPPLIGQHDLHELHFVYDPGGIALQGEASMIDCPKRLISSSTYQLLLAISRSGKAGPEACKPSSPADTALLCDILQEYCSRHLERIPHRKHLDIVSRILTTEG